MSAKPYANSAAAMPVPPIASNRYLAATVKWEELQAETQRLGFVEAGVVAVGPSHTHTFYQDWLERGSAAGMQYLHRHSSWKKDLSHFAPWARSVLVLAHPYCHHEAVSPPNQAYRDTTTKNTHGLVSCYAHGLDYHQILGDKLEQLACWISEQLPYPLRHLVCVDTKPLMERELAARAGLGWVGKNAMLIHHRHGSWWFLAELLVNCPLPCNFTAAKTASKSKNTPASTVAQQSLGSETYQQNSSQALSQILPIPDSCGSCRACLDACPTQALGAPKTLDASRCISYLTIEHKGPLPAHLRTLMDNWIFGCDICQKVCPWNRTSTSTSEAGFFPQVTQVQSDLLELLKLNEYNWRMRFQRTPLARAKRCGLLRNAAVALGNQLRNHQLKAATYRRAVGVLCRSLSQIEPEPLVRGAAAWALAKSQHRSAVRWLKRAVRYETNPQVLYEIAQARAQCVVLPTHLLTSSTNIL